MATKDKKQSFSAYAIEAVGVYNPEVKVSMFEPNNPFEIETYLSNQSETVDAAHFAAREIRACMSDKPGQGLLFTLFELFSAWHHGCPEDESVIRTLMRAISQNGVHVPNSTDRFIVCYTHGPVLAPDHQFMVLPMGTIDAVQMPNIVHVRTGK